MRRIKKKLPKKRKNKNEKYRTGDTKEQGKKAAR